MVDIFMVNYFFVFKWFWYVLFWLVRIVMIFLKNIYEIIIIFNVCDIFFYNLKMDFVD